MKKFVPAILAIMLIVGFSAFTVISKNKAKHTGTEYYWYEMQSATQINHNAPLNGGTAISKEDLLNNPELLPCPEGTDVDCVRGFTIPQFTDVTSGEADAIQKKVE